MRISSPVKRSSAFRVSCDAMFLAAAMILSYIESCIPLILAFPVPGIKLGLANIAVMAAAYDVGNARCNIADAAAISFMRITLTALMFGTVTTLWFSLTGGAVSFIMLVICRKLFYGRVTVIGASVACAAGHNAGQVIAAAALFGEASLFSFMPWLLLISVFTGLATGMLLYMLSGRLKRIADKDDM